jgi:hypothetical protein
MNRNLSGFAIASAVILAVTVTTTAFAQTDSRTTTVNERQRPELDPLGVKSGGFTIFPSVEVSGTYNDNIFATDAGTIDDVITTITPAVRISSDWAQHYVGFNATGDIVRYADNGAEDHETYNLALDGRLDIRRDTNVTGRAAYELGSEERGSVNDAGGRTPTEFDVQSLEAGMFNKWNRVSLNADGSLFRRDYDDVTTTTGIVNNDDRDRDEFGLTVRGGYEIQEQYEAFAEVILTSINYDAAVDDNGLNRDSEGYEVRAGARIDLTGLLFGDVFIGYLSRDYEGAGLKSVETVVGGIDLTWNVTPLTTLTGGLSRNVSETTLAAASGNLTTELRVGADHELLRNLIVSARVAVSTDEFEGTSREDDYIKGGIGAKYMLNRNFSVVLDYDYSERDSSVAGADNEINKILLRLRAQL